jgi:hypothetical protein
LAELLFRRRHSHLSAREIGVGCQSFSSIATADHANLGTDLWILTIDATRADRKESQPSGITAPDRNNEEQREKKFGAKFVVDWIEN